MGTSYVAVDIKVPVATIYSYVKDSIIDPKFLTAYRHLQQGKRGYSGRIVQETENRQLVSHEQGLNITTGTHYGGWTITYDFESVSETETKVGILIEYSVFMAFLAMFTLKAQSINEILGRVQSLLALEHAPR